jgi:hypothetical protein
MNKSGLIKIFYHNRHNWIAVATFFITLAYYLMLLHVNTNHAHDSLTYYNNIITMNIEWHTHHVLYEPISFIWIEFTKLVFPYIHPFKLISAMNSFFGAGCISLIYLLLTKRLSFSMHKALICCTAIGSSFYYLNYATTVEVYHSALFFMLATFYYATKTTHIRLSDAMVIGILHGLAMSFHQMHILLGVVLLPRILKAGYWQFFIYILYGTIIVVFTYLLACYAEHIHSIQAFKEYFIGYMGNKRIISESSSPIFAPFGLGIALLGGRYIMATQPFKGFIEHNLSSALYERIFYLHHQTGIISGVLQIALYCVFLVCFFLMIRHYIKTLTLKQINIQYEYYVLILIYSLFFTFWYPHNPEFWGVSMTFMIIVIFFKIQNIFLLMIMSVSICMINLLGSGLPLLDPKNNLYPENIHSLFAVDVKK